MPDLHGKRTPTVVVSRSTKDWFGCSGFTPAAAAYMAALAAERGVEPAAVALNWCRAHGAMPIPGIRRIEQVEAIRQSLRWSMSFEELQRLDDAAAMLQGGMPANPFNSS